MILTKYGKKEWGMALAAFLVVFVLCAATVFLRILPPGIAGVITAFAALACFAACAFFRDPPRRIAEDPSAIVSPADGVIRDVELIKSETLENDDLRRLFHDKDILRIGIFLSVFNVHINRAPWDMKVEFKFYKPGKYLDARDPDAPGRSTNPCSSAAPARSRERPSPSPSARSPARSHAASSARSTPANPIRAARNTA